MDTQHFTVLLQAQAHPLGLRVFSTHPQLSRQKFYAEMRRLQIKNLKIILIDDHLWLVQQEAYNANRRAQGTAPNKAGATALHQA